MIKNKTLSAICTLIFLLGIIAAFLGAFTMTESKIIMWILLIISVIYLLSGWYLFKGYYPDGHPLLLFLIGYLYSSIFMAFTFMVAGWPLAETFIAIAIAWAAIQMGMITFIRKKLPGEGVVQFLIEGGIMLIMTIAILIYK